MWLVIVLLMGKSETAELGSRGLRAVRCSGGALNAVVIDRVGVGERWTGKRGVKGRQTR